MITRPELPPKEGYVEVEAGGVRRYRSMSTGMLLEDELPPVPTEEELRSAKLAELSDACAAAITAGCDVALTDGSTGHISLTAEDQINLSTATQAVGQGAAGYPYHLDGQLCTLYPAADIMTMARAATAHKLYHTTYYNHLAAWVRRCGSVEAVEAITYGAELPEGLAENMEAVLNSAMTASSGQAGSNCAQPLDVAVARSIAARGEGSAM